MDTMSPKPPRARLTRSQPPRVGVVDLGSNSVRLVIFEGLSRNPLPIFNEKAVLGLGRGLQITGKLNEEAIGPALTVMSRYAAVARAMGADPLEVLATAATRDARSCEGSSWRYAPASRHPIRILSARRRRRIRHDGRPARFRARTASRGDMGGARSNWWSSTRGRPCRRTLASPRRHPPRPTAPAANVAARPRAGRGDPARIPAPRGGREETLPRRRACRRAM
jgi:hypothetical protein